MPLPIKKVGAGDSSAHVEEKEIQTLHESSFMHPYAISKNITKKLF